MKNSTQLFTIATGLILTVAAYSTTAQATVTPVDGFNHLPTAPTWVYGTKGEVRVSPVGTDMCEMSTGGPTCDGANVLISGQAALIIFNQLPQKAVDGVKTAKGIECSKDKCVFHISADEPAAGELPWKAD